MKLNSLRQRLAAWLAVVLTTLLLIDGGFSYNDALQVTNHAYDRSIKASLKDIGEHIYTTDGSVEVDIPYSALEFFEAGSADRIFYSVGPPNDQPITGYPGLPHPAHLKPNEPVFYDASYEQQAVRLGALLKPLYRTDHPRAVLVIFGETTNSRQQVVHTLFFREVGRKVTMLLIVLAVVNLATMLAVKPVARLGEDIRGRSDNDLTPVDTSGVPNEVIPLVEAINHHMGRIDRMIEIRRRFIADAAHQLRTPLAVLKTQSEYALRQQDYPPMRLAVDALSRSLGSAIRLTNQLLSLSRAEHLNGLSAAAFQRINLVSLARETVIDLLPLAAQKQIDLGFDTVETTLAVKGNPVLLREMLVNLIDNAVRYTPAGGSATVQVVGSEETALLRISDSGPGIAPEHHDAVFLRFFRLDTGDYTGSGLGLSIVREIVDSHGGAISLHGNGSLPGLLVIVTLPLAPLP